MQPDFFEHPRNLDAAVHGTIEHCCLAGAVNLPGQCLGLRCPAPKCLDKLTSHFFERVDFIVEQDHPGRCLNRLVGIGRNTTFGLLVHYSSPVKGPIDAKETAS